METLKQRRKQLLVGALVVLMTVSFFNVEARSFCKSKATNVKDAKAECSNAVKCSANKTLKCKLKFNGFYRCACKKK